MNQTASQSVIDLLLASGVPTREEAVQLAQNMNGGSWTAQVLDSGKVDEQRFLSVDRNIFPRAGHLARSENDRSQNLVDPAEPVRFPTSHSADRDKGELGRACDLRSVQLVRPAACRSAFEKTGRMGAGAARPTAPRDENALRRRRRNVRRNSQEQTRLRKFAGRRNRDRHQLGRSGSVGGEVREPDHSRRQSSNARPTFTSSRSRTTFGFVTGSTAFCTKSRCRRSCACCIRPSFRV